MRTASVRLFLLASVLVLAADASAGAPGWKELFSSGYRAFTHRDYRGALTRLRQAIEVGTPSEADRSDALYLLSICSYNVGDAVAAIDYAKRTVESVKRAYGGASRQEVAALSNLGGLFTTFGMYGAARKVLWKAQAIAAKGSGIYLGIATITGGYCAATGSNRVALTLFRRIRSTLLKRPSSQVRRSVVNTDLNIAECLSGMEEYSQAERAYRRAMTEGAALGKSDPLALESQLGLAVVALHQNRAKAGQEYAERLVRSVVVEHTWYLRIACMVVYAQCCLKLQEKEKAESAICKAEIYAEPFPDSFPWRQRIARIKAAVMFEKGQTQRALKAIGAVEQAQIKMYGKNSPDLLPTRLLRGRILVELRRWKDAEAEFGNANALAVTLLVMPDGLTSEKILRELALIYRKEGDAKRAARMEKQADSIRHQRESAKDQAGHNAGETGGTAQSPKKQ